VRAGVIDNNPAERAMHPIGIGRKNWLFAGNDVVLGAGERHIRKIIRRLGAIWSASSPISSTPLPKIKPQFGVLLVAK
jgi:hypothetical protein